MGKFNNHIVLPKKEKKTILEELAHWEIEIKVEMSKLSSLPQNVYRTERGESTQSFWKKSDVRHTISDMIEDLNWNRKKTVLLIGWK